MKTLSFDRSEIQQRFESCESLGDIITRIESDLSSTGQVVCEIAVNGVVLSEGDEVKFAQSPRQSIHDLQIKSNTPSSLIDSALASALEFGPRLIQSCLATAETFRTIRLGDAHRSFKEMVEGTQWLVETLVHVRGAASNTGQPIGFAERWLEAEIALNHAMKEVADAYAKNDWVLVADLLEYEITGTLEIWMQAIQNEVARRG
jgi:hypothetical protein